MMANDIQIKRHTKQINENTAVYTYEAVNKGDKAVCAEEAVCWSGEMPYAAETPLYGEGHTMLSQYEGTVGKVRCITNHSDKEHYRYPSAEGMTAVYNMLLFQPHGEDAELWGFTSANRFSGEIRFNTQRYEIVQRLYGIELAPGEKAELESFCVIKGEKNECLAQFSRLISEHHPALPVKEEPMGWCSWYCFGSEVTRKDIESNMDYIVQNMPELKYIMIDDGYQDKMGDWLVDRPDFGSLKELCHAIKEKGLEPAIWVAPFIAEKDSRIFQEHPEYFVQDEDGTPLASDKYSFGGWRRGPWYMLDGTHPGAREYLKTVFSTMREEYRCRYFKLDANAWGEMPFGKRYDSNKTAVEAYRMGMKAILEAAGTDAFLLGCNAPMWASIGVVHGMRVSGDINRIWKTFQMVSKETLSRNWQNRTLWLNDPDCIVLSQSRIFGTGIEMTEDEFDFMAAYIFASGGNILSGDDLPGLSPKRADLLRRLIKLQGGTAQFDGNDFSLGRTEYQGHRYLTLLNAEDSAKEFDIPAGPDGYLDIILMKRGHRRKIVLPPHSGKILEIL